MNEDSAGAPPPTPRGEAGNAQRAVVRWILGLAAAALLVYWVFDAAWERLLFAPVEPFTHHEPDARYEALFPYYVELCSTTQYRSQSKGMGGTPGHAVMYIKGACRDVGAPYPKLRRCAGNVTDTASPEHGAGISVNRWLRNANWVAFAGRGQFYGDDLGRDQVVTLARMEAASRKAIADGVFDGIELWPYRNAPPEPDLFHFVMHESAGTDFALLYARSALCGRVPIRREMLDEVIEFLNDLNREYTTGAAEYQWSGFHDNCVHALRNALAAAGIGEPISVGETKLRQLFHLAVPANEAINLAALGTSGPLESYPAIYDSDSMRSTLLEFGWLPTRHGALLVSLPVHPENEAFDPNPVLLAFQGALTLRTTKRLLRMLDDPRYTDLEPNLVHFEEIYRRILSGRTGEDNLAGLRGDRYRRVRRRYLSVIEAELGEVERMRAELANPPLPAVVSTVSP